MSGVPPADYVEFVDRCLPQIRARVGHEVPAPGQAEVVGEVLAELAGRWAVLRAAARLGWPGLTERWLDRGVRRQARRWRERQIYPVEVVIWDDSAVLPPPPRPEVSPPSHGPRSVALRRAAVLDSTVRGELATLAEATIGWWHAYDARRRAGRIAKLTLAVLFLLAFLTMPR